MSAEGRSTPEKERDGKVWVGSPTGGARQDGKGTAGSTGLGVAGGKGGGLGQDTGMLGETGSERDWEARGTPASGFLESFPPYT